MADVIFKREALSPRERQILTMAAKGMADKEIAVKIGISIGTVRTHWQRMRDKTNARSRSEILCLCLERRHSDLVEQMDGLSERLHALFHGAAVGLALVNGDDEIVEANPAFAHQVGVERSDLIGAKPGLVAPHQVRRHEVVLGGEKHWVVTLVEASVSAGLPA